MPLKSIRILQHSSLAALVALSLSAVVIAAVPADAAGRRKAAATGSKSTGLMSRPVVKVSETYAPGSIIVVNKERRLYLVEAKGRAITYPVAIGKPGTQWTGNLFVQSRAVNPSWTDPDSGRFVPGGPGNPLGARALYLGWTHYRIHGTNNPGSIGSAASHGCFRMLNEHVKDLYPRVHIGAPVYVIETMRDAPVQAVAEEPINDRDPEPEATEG
jgi:lipoprotein-anchoring transpeptidase ErfK/SrfK